jgi:hypothetical protein
MQIGNTLEQGTDELRCLIFRESRATNNPFEEFTAHELLHDNVHVGSALVDPLHLDDVGMVHKLQDCRDRERRRDSERQPEVRTEQISRTSNFCSQERLLFRFNGSLLNNLHSITDTSELVDTFTHSTESPSSQFLADHIVLLNWHHLSSVLELSEPIFSLML